MYDPIIFDLDGTLLNTLADLSAAGNYALKTLGFPTHPEEKYKLFVCNGREKLIERMLPENHSREDFQAANELFKEYYGAHSLDLTKPYDGIPELLSRLCESGLTCLCNTNKDHVFSRELLRKFFGGNITELVGGAYGFPTKPSPEAALFLANKHKKSGKNPLYVGDSSVDMETAKAAGFDACGVLWGFRSREELEAYSPKFLAANPKALGDFILGGQ